MAAPKKQEESSDDSESDDSDSSDDDVSSVAFDDVWVNFVWKHCLLRKFVMDVYFVQKKVTPTIQVKKPAAVLQKVDSSDSSSDDSSSDEKIVRLQMPFSI